MTSGTHKEQSRTQYNRMCINQQPYRFLCVGQWAPQQVAANFTDRLYKFPGDHAAFARTYWQSLKSEHLNKYLFNGDLFRLDTFSATSDHLRLELSQTCYRDQIYSNEHTTSLVNLYDEKAPTWGVGISALIVTTDGFIPIIRRSDKVQDGSGKLDVIGGHADPARHLCINKVDLFAAISDEIKDELNLGISQFSIESCCGIALVLPTLKPEIVFIGYSTQTMKQIEQEAYHSPEAYEFTNIFGVKATAPELKKFIQKNSIDLTPSAHACLELFMIL